MAQLVSAGPDSQVDEILVTGEGGGSGEKTRTIIIATDSSEHSQAAFKSYLDVVHRPENSVIVINVYEPPILHASGGLGASTVEWKRQCEEKMEKAKSLQKQFVQEMKDAGITGKSVICVSEKAGPGLVKYAYDQKADMIVIGSRGLGTIRRTLMGSHSAYVVHHAHIPVIVVPPPAVKHS